MSISVPRGAHEAYDTEVDTSSGNRDVTVNSDVSADRVLRAVTSSGDVAIGYRENP